MSQQLTAVGARWTVLPHPAGGLEAAEGVTVLVRGNRIDDVVRRPVRRRRRPPDRAARRDRCCPGSSTSTTTRSTGRSSAASSTTPGAGRPGVVADNIVYSLLLPLGDLAGRRAFRRGAAGGIPARDARAAAVGHDQRPRHAACGAPLVPRRSRRARAARLRRAVHLLGARPRRRRCRPTALRRHRRGRLPRARRSPSPTSTTRDRTGGSGSASARTPPTPAPRACCAGSPTWPASATPS